MRTLGNLKINKNEKKNVEIDRSGLRLTSSSMSPRIQIAQNEKPKIRGIFPIFMYIIWNSSFPLAQFKDSNFVFV